MQRDLPRRHVAVLSRSPLSASVEFSPSLQPMIFSLVFSTESLTTLRATPVLLQRRFHTVLKSTGTIRRTCRKVDNDDVPTLFEFDLPVLQWPNAFRAHIQIQSTFLSLFRHCSCDIDICTWPTKGNGC